MITQINFTAKLLIDANTPEKDGRQVAVDYFDLTSKTWQPLTQPFVGVNGEYNYSLDISKSLELNDLINNSNPLYFPALRLRDTQQNSVGLAEILAYGGHVWLGSLVPKQSIGIKANAKTAKRSVKSRTISAKAENIFQAEPYIANVNFGKLWLMEDVKRLEAITQAGQLGLDHVLIAFNTFGEAGNANDCEQLLEPLRIQIGNLNDQVINLNNQVNTLTSQNNSLTAQNTSLTNQNNSLNAQITSLNGTVLQLRTSNNTLSAQNASLTAQVTTLQSDVAAKTQQISVLEGQIQIKDDLIAELRARIAELENGTTQQRTQEANKVYSNVVKEIAKATQELNAANSSYQISNLALDLKVLVKNEDGGVKLQMVDDTLAESINGDALSNIRIEVKANDLSSINTATNVLPNIIGLTETEVRKKLQNYGLKLNPIYEFSDTRVIGQAFKQFPESSVEIVEGSTITVFFAKKKGSLN